MPPHATTGFVVTILTCATALITGLLWDVSWHQSIGRDSIFAPPHILEYLAAGVAGLTCSYTILRTTFAGSASEVAWSVRVWGFRGPLGAWITLWGVLTLLFAVPLDNWWHDAYGLDVKVFAPAHFLLSVGITSVIIGALVLTAAAQNRALQPLDRRRDAMLYAIAGGTLCISSGVLSLNVSLPAYQHSGVFYVSWALLFPPLLACYARVGRAKYPAASAALVFMCIWFAVSQVLRQFPAQPHLGPIYNHRTYMWPPFFPNLLVVPALGIDLVRRRLTSLDSWKAAAIIGATFLVLFVAAQWPFSRFMISPAAQNWFFNGSEFSYSFGGTNVHRYRSVGSFSIGMGLAVALALSVVTSRVGLAWGAWMERIKR